MTNEEAINIVRNIYQTDKEKEALSVLIPELSESEDEKIRKMLIQYFSDEDSTNGFSNKDIIAWLEKQKEQNEKPSKPELKTPEWVYGGWDDERMINNVIGSYILHAEVAKKQGDTHMYNLSKSMENWLRKVVRPLLLEEQESAKWGAEHRDGALSCPQPSDDLKCKENGKVHYPSYKSGYFDGRADEKKQMKKKAISGSVHHALNTHYIEIDQPQLNAILKEFDQDEKAKVIILHDNE